MKHAEVGELSPRSACPRCNGPRFREFMPQRYWRKVSHRCTTHLMERIESLEHRMGLVVEALEAVNERITLNQCPPPKIN